MTKEKTPGNKSQNKNFSLPLNKILMKLRSFFFYNFLIKKEGERKLITKNINCQHVRLLFKNLHKNTSSEIIYYDKSESK